MRGFVGHGESGQTLPLAAILLAVVMGFTALAVDVGFQRYQHEVQQIATDSAAVAGAETLKYSPTSQQVIAAAVAAATNNGFTSDASHTVTVNYAPADGPFEGDPDSVEVTINSKHPTFFERVLGAMSFPVGTRSVARYNAGPTACIYALSTKGALVMNATTLNAPNCGLLANNTLTTSAGTVTLSSIGAVGQITANATTFPQAKPAKAVLSTDPCPSFSGCLAMSQTNYSAMSCDFNKVTVSSGATLNPGVYCGGLTFNAVNVTLNPGVYVVKGGATLNASSLTGNGVTIVNVDGTLVSNASVLALVAPSSGSTAGMLFYQPSGNTNQMTLNASSTIGLQGGLYVPSATLVSNAGFTKWMLIIASSITFNGGGVNLPVSNAPFPGTDSKAFLAE